MLTSGALELQHGTTVKSSDLVANSATGGADGSGGTTSQGVGDVVYKPGTLIVESLSLIVANLASRSDNDVSGPLAPI
jgi:hypothetical protein